MKQNVIFAALQTGNPVTYFHTHTLSRDTLEAAVTVSKSIEIDIACDDSGKPYVGHPISYYRFNNMAVPDNMPLDEALELLAKHRMFVVIDCKDVRALPYVKHMIRTLGPEHVLFHAWAKELCFEPYQSGTIIEPHWINENLPLSAIHDLHREYDVPIALSCRGLTAMRLRREPNLLFGIINNIQFMASALNCNLPGGHLPSTEVTNKLLKAGILPFINCDIVKPQDRPSTYVGMTDLLDQSTNFELYSDLVVANVLAL